MTRYHYRYHFIC